MRSRAAAVALACVASIACWAGGRPAVRVYSESNELLGTVQAPDGFTIVFIHSINLSPVHEQFKVGDDGALWLERMLFDQMSTGMPSGDEEGFELVDGHFATSPHRQVRELNLRISPVPGHALIAGERTIPFRNWAPIGSLLRLRGVPTYSSTLDRTHTLARP